MLPPQSQKTNKYKEGDLIVIVQNNNWTLCYNEKSPPPKVKECPVRRLEQYTDPQVGKYVKNIEGKVGLVVYVERNRLSQDTGYRVLIEGTEMLFKSIVAKKYFKLVETSNDESGRSGAF
tara:strand:- start:651 stop:1010 length:360 start_codon:yes stop_codon:yes gene_type:complete